MVGDDPEDELAARQGPRLYPVGLALRSTYDADNHDSLDPVATALMLDLARLDPPLPGSRDAAVVEGKRATLVDRLLTLIAGRRDQRTD